MLRRLRRLAWWAIRRWRTPVWVTKDLRQLRLADMSDDHLQNCLRAIKDGRLFASCFIGPPELYWVAASLDPQFDKNHEGLRGMWLREFTKELAYRGVAV